MEYTTPVTTAFEAQRATIQQSQRALEHTVAFQKRMGEAFVGSFDSTESAQRRAVELSRSATHSYLDAVESMTPGATGTVEELRAAVDEQYDFLLENHAETFETVAAEYEEGIDAYDDVNEDYLAALDEQVEMLVEAHEALEDQSVEATEQWSAQLEQLQDQVEEVTEQVQDVQEQAAEAVEIDVEE